MVKKIDKHLRYLPVFGLIYYFFKDLFIVIKKRFIDKEKIVPEWAEFFLIVGRRGSGKTLALTYLLEDYRAKFGDKILICTNYNYKNQDFPLISWRQFLEKYDKPIIFAVDEIQNEFESTRWASFPMPVFNEFTLSRKNKKMLISTAQEFERVDKKIRTYSNTIIHMKKFANRLFWMRYFDRFDFELSQLSGKRTPETGEKLGHKLFIAHDEIRQLYDTNEIVKRIETAGYDETNAL